MPTSSISVAVSFKCGPRSRATTSSRPNNATDTQLRWTRGLPWLTPDSPKYSYGLYDYFDHRPAVLAEARSHAEEALRLDPHCGQAHMEMAGILSWSVKSIERDKAMKQEVDSALRLLPNDGYLVMLAALFQTDMDWLEEAEATFQRAIEINPREPKVFYNYFILLTKKGDVAKARWASDRSLELAPESVFFRLGRAIRNSPGQERWREQRNFSLRFPRARIRMVE